MPPCHYGILPGCRTALQIITGLPCRGCVRPRQRCARYWHRCQSNPAALGGRTIRLWSLTSEPSRRSAPSLSAESTKELRDLQRPNSGRQRCDRSRRGNSRQAAMASTRLENWSGSHRSRRRQPGASRRRRNGAWPRQLPDAASVNFSGCPWPAWIGATFGIAITAAT